MPACSSISWHKLAVCKKSIASNLNAALLNHKLLFASAINIMGNAITSVNRFADERREKKRLRKAFRRLSEEEKTLCLHVATTMDISEEIPTISCCETPPAMCPKIDKPSNIVELKATNLNQSPPKLDTFWRLNVGQAELKLDEEPTSAVDANISSPIIQDEECCDFSIELRNLDSGLESVTSHSEDEIEKTFNHKSNQPNLVLPTELIQDLAELKIFTRPKPKVRPSTKRPPTSYTISCLRTNLLQN